MPAPSQKDHNSVHRIIIILYMVQMYIHSNMRGFFLIKISMPYFEFLHKNPQSLYVLQHCPTSRARKSI